MYIPTLFNNEYEGINEIGRGGFCTVFKVRNVIDKKFYALKLFYDSKELYEKEMNALKIFKNKNITQLKGGFFDETNQGYCIVMELCDGNLRDILKKYKPKGLPINIIKKIFIQLNDALKAMIDIELIHRNLKPFNILIKYTDKNRTNFDIKLSSFKFSEYITEKIEEYEYDYCGTLNYMAPEVEKSYYNNKCDLWSLGVILYELYTNKYIFYSNNKEETRINRKKGIIKNETDNEMINKLIRKLIQVDIDKRITWEEYFKDEFFKN